MPRPRPQMFPIDYVSIRAAIANIVSKVTLTDCIQEEQTGPNFPRPELPYFSFKLTSPGIKSGDDHPTTTLNGVTNKGGQRKIMVSFHCYACSKDDAYSYMTLLQSSLDLDTVQESFRRAKIAVWLIGNVADLSLLLNTGYEGRTQLDVSFGVAANLGESLGSIDQVGISGTVNTDSGVNTTTFLVDNT